MRAVPVRRPGTLHTHRCCTWHRGGAPSPINSGAWPALPFGGNQSDSRGKSGTSWQLNPCGFPLLHHRGSVILVEDGISAYERLSFDGNKIFYVNFLGLHHEVNALLMHRFFFFIINPDFSELQIKSHMKARRWQFLNDCQSCSERQSCFRYHRVSIYWSSLAVGLDLG